MKHPIFLLMVLFGFNRLLVAGNSQINDLILDNQGNLLAVGLADNLASNTTDFALARYLTDGTLDDTFNPTGVVPGLIQIDIPEPVPQQDTLLQETNEGLLSVQIDGQGGIVGAGFSSVGLVSRMAVLKLTSDGTIDPLFNANTQLGPTPGLALISVGQIRSAANATDNFSSDTATGVALDSQGRIVVVGTSDNGQNLELVVARLTPDGSLDVTFNGQSSMPGIVTLSQQNSSISATAVALNLDDSIVVGGTVVSGANTSEGLVTSFIVAKFSSSGVLDESFNQFGATPGFVIETFGSVDSEAFAIKIDALGRIVIGGLTQTLVQGGIIEAGSIQSQFALARYTADGTLDTLFNAGVTPGTQVTSISQNSDSIRGLALTDDGKIVVTGFTDDGANRSFATARYLENGTLDETFNPDGAQPGVIVTTVSTILAAEGDTASGAQNEAHAVVIGTGNQIYSGGFSSDGLQTNFTLLNYLENGDVNPLFNPTPVPPGQVGIVITPFGQSISALGNGVPLFLSQSAAGVGVDIIDRLSQSPVPIAPHIVSDLSELGKTLQPVVQGYASPNAHITLYINEVPVAETRASPTGLWQISLDPFKSGTFEMVAISTDPLVGLSLASAPVSFRVGSDELIVPYIESPKAQEKVVRKKISIVGRADANKIVEVTIDGKLYGKTTADKQGKWHLAIDSLPQGEHQVTATSLAKSGGRSHPSEPVRFTLEHPLEKAPRITAPVPGFVCVQAECAFEGQGVPFSPVVLFMNGKREAEVMVGADGTWRYMTKDLKGEYELYVTCGSETCRSEKVRFRVEKNGESVAAVTRVGSAPSVSPALETVKK